ncbi:asparaginase [candidate division KSB1 bacterium]|nr:asparaginase [candidate division KSB1 bacterium]
MRVDAMNKKESRRHFLKKVSGIGAAAMTAPLWKIENSSAANSHALILCNRSEYWGKKVTKPGWEILEQGGNVLDAVEQSANIAEKNPEDLSVGYGSIPNEHGEIQLDASVMYGPKHGCGAVAALEYIKTPSSVARKVMERTDHILLAGEGALHFALMHGFQKENLMTERARTEWLRWKENLNENDSWIPPKDDLSRNQLLYGTLNVLAVDVSGNLAGINSTSSQIMKMPGRVGDAPLIGSGLFVDNEAGAAAASGRGEEVIRSCGSYLIIELMRQGMPPQKACEEACLRIIRINGGNEKVRQSGFNVMFCALSKAGQVGCASLRPVMEQQPQISLVDITGFHVYNGTNIID